MSVILKFDFQKRKQLNFSEENYPNYIKKKDTILHVSFTLSLKQGEARTSSGPICVPLSIKYLLFASNKCATVYTNNTLQWYLNSWYMCLTVHTNHAIKQMSQSLF